MHTNPRVTISDLFDYQGQAVGELVYPCVILLHMLLSRLASRSRMLYILNMEVNLVDWLSILTLTSSLYTYVLLPTMTNHFVFIIVMIIKK